MNVSIKLYRETGWKEYEDVDHMTFQIEFIYLYKKNRKWLASFNIKDIYEIYVE